MSRRFVTLILFSVLLLTALQASPAADELPSPEQFFGFRMGAEGKIIDYLRSLEYYQLLAAGSDRMSYEELGKTTDGHPFVLLIISSPKNMARLEEFRTERDRLCDPRSMSDEEAMRLAEELPAVAFHTGAIHSAEITCGFVAPELVYDLVTGETDEIRRIIDNVITLVIPNANPDGLVMIKEWFDANEGQTWEGRMPWLYQSYVGHDNNRDWIMLHFAEQRLTATKVYNRWHPIYSVEMHQMGTGGARLFVPPYKDPLDPNTAPQMIETMNIIGMAMSNRLTMEGKAGVVKNAIFDLYTPARAYNTNHGIARILTETASANLVRSIEIKPEGLADMELGEGEYNPVKSSWNFPFPWKGGIWSPRMMVEYQYSLNMAALDQLAAHRVQFNKAQYFALKRACEGEGWPYAYVIPTGQRDPGSAALMLQALQRGEAEVQQATTPFEAEGRRFEAGSYVVILRQPYAAWVKSLLEDQEYPDLRRRPTDAPEMPYDVTAHTLPLLMGVEAVAVKDKIEAPLELVTETITAKGVVEGDGRAGYAIDPSHNDAYAVADDLLDAGFKVARLRENTEVDGTQLAVGSFVVFSAKGLKEKLEGIADGRYFVAHGLRKLPATAKLASLSNPRIGIYEPWGGNMDAGWTRKLFELWGLEHETLRNADFRMGNLKQRFDAIIFADGMVAFGIKQGRKDWPEQYQGGIGDEGVAALRSFVQEGGVAIAFGNTSMALANLLELPVADKLKGLKQQEHFCPGAIVRVKLDTSSPLAYGMPEELAVLKVWGPAFVPAPDSREWDGLEMVGVYPESNVRMSGFLLGPEYLENAGALAAQKLGKGEVVLFSFRPQFRDMTDGGYKLLFNAVFIAAEAK
jgi:hypothetical protein